ncbi:MAG: hypothetical protein KGZ68_04415 [Dechloromonas sp.]|nr:hypothetical protein [Dechloromonas sp.]
MTLLLRDFVTTKLATAPAGTTGTALTVQAGDGALFPAMSGEDTVPAVIEAIDGSAREAVMITGRTGDSFVITRSASPVDWTGSGQVFYLTVTAAGFDELRKASGHTVVPAGGITTTTSQAALEELDERITAVSQARSATQGAVDGLIVQVATKAPTANPTFTGAVTLPGDAAAPLQAVSLQQLVAYIENQCFDVGDYKMTSRTSFGAGRRWLPCDSRTIGSATSGATGLASAEAEALFVHLWTIYDNSICPIQDANGVATTRGASASADWASNKRLPVLDWRGLVPRVHHNGMGAWESDTTRVLGSFQGDAIRNITGDFGAQGDSGGFQSFAGAFTNNTTAPGWIGSSASYQVGLRFVRFDASLVVPTATENRVRNRSLNMFIRY